MVVRIIELNLYFSRLRSVFKVRIYQQANSQSFILIFMTLRICATDGEQKRHDFFVWDFQVDQIRLSGEKSVVCCWWKISTYVDISSNKPKSLNQKKPRLPCLSPLHSKSSAFKIYTCVCSSVYNYVYVTSDIY